MNPSQKILLIQLYSNGDSLYATAVARQIKQDYPGCHLTWAIADYCKNILFNNPFIDELLVIQEINFNNWDRHWKKLWQQIEEYKREGRFDRVYFTQLVDRNLANYDHCIRSGIFRGYDRPITVPVQPVLRLTDAERDRVSEFAAKHRLSNYREVLLLEYAPRSKQAKFSAEMALDIAGRVTADAGIAVILSSNEKLEVDNPSILDASYLSLREIAGLSNHCTLLVGCSSGVTWATTSDAGKRLNMIQVLDPRAYWLNSVVNDHQRFGLPVDHIIEIEDSSADEIYQCVRTVLDQDFPTARERYHTEMPVRFRITRGILVYLLGKGDIRAALKHIRINLSVFGWKPRLMKAIFLGITTFPIMNYITKRKAKRQ